MNETFPDALNVAVFGQTEMSPITCVLEGKDALRKIGSIGKVVPAVTARVIDPEQRRRQGEVGEIVYRGPNMMKGYWQNEQGTADAFAGGWFHSGDLVRQDEEGGFLYVVDRAKDMIISGGENIYCAEVENVLFGHPSISEAAIIGRAHEKWGEVPVAVVVPPAAGVEDLTLADLEPYLNENLARFKHPKDLVIVEELPRNAGARSSSRPCVRPTVQGRRSGELTASIVSSARPGPR